MLTGGARHISEMGSSDPFPAHTADGALGTSSRCGRAGTGHTSDAGLQLHQGTGDAGWAPSLLSPSPPHPSLHAIVAWSSWEWRGCWDDRVMAPTLPSYCGWQACIRRQHMFGLGASSPPLPTLMTAQPLQSASSDCLIQTCTILQNPLTLSSQTSQRLVCGLMLVAAMSISDSVHVPAQTRHLPHASGPKPLSANLIF